MLNILGIADIYVLLMTQFSHSTFVVVGLLVVPRILQNNILIRNELSYYAMRSCNYEFSPISTQISLLITTI